MNPPFCGGTFVADTSAWVYSGHPAVASDWLAAMEAEQLVLSAPVHFELLYSARDAVAIKSLEADLAYLRELPLNQGIVAAALTGLRELAAKGPPGYHRVPFSDALTAAAAADRGVGVLHYDHHFDRLQEVMNFDSRWIGKAGSLV